jgi:hypothetical protein
MRFRLLLAAAFCLALATAGTSAASASAAVWKDKGVNVTKAFTLGLTGGETVEVEPGGWINCELHATLSSSGGSSGQITAWDQKNCSGSGTLASCVVTPEARFLPWTVTVNAANLSISAGSVKFIEVKSSCPFSDHAASVAGMKMTPDSTTSISEFGYFASSGVTGSVLVDSPNTGTYGIG